MGGPGEPLFLANARVWAAALGDIDAQVVLTERSGDHGGALWFDTFPLVVARAFG